MKNSNEVTVTLNELATILANYKVIEGMPLTASVETLTIPQTNKKCRDTKEPFTDVITKYSKYDVFLNTKYERAIELAKIREEAKGLETSEYEKGINTMPVDFSDSKNIFFGYYTNKNGDSKAVLVNRPNTNHKPETKYYLNGKLVEKSTLPNVLPLPSKAENQGLNKDIAWRKPYLENYLSITLDKKKYILIK